LDGDVDIRGEWEEEEVDSEEFAAVGKGDVGKTEAG